MSVEQVPLDGDLMSKVRQVVAADAVSAFIETAVDRALKDHAFGRILDELEAEIGPPAEDVRAEAEAFWRAG